jgi:hypothetical protein
MMDKIIKTKYELNPSNFSDASHARTHTYKENAFQNQLFISTGAENV